MDRLLAQLGWPLAGEACAIEGTAEHSAIWQAYQAWQECLRELASLDATVATLGRQAAINQLQQICRERIFQARTPPASIQVLGLYEVNGLHFDHLWVLGLHNDNWPPAAQPNPFIPGLLQATAHLPHSSPQRELDVARAITRRLLESAEDCVFSYPGQIDGEEVPASPLLTDACFQLVDEIEGWQGDRWQTTISRADPPLIQPLQMPGPSRHGTARGGSSILKHQALCPFRAFASNRLGAVGLETPMDGISPMLHGSLVHQVLEGFWTETRTLEALLALDEASLDARVRLHVDRVLSNERSLTDRPEFREVEGRRLVRLTAACLVLEKSRDPFEVVGFEQEVLQEIEGQMIRLVIDRIDQLPGGESVIIDYKTGKVDPKKWFGERPEDPQLPLYATSAGQPPAAIAFAVIRDDQCLYSGVVTREGIPSDFLSSWPCQFSIVPPNCSGTFKIMSNKWYLVRFITAGNFQFLLHCSEPIIHLNRINGLTKARRFGPLKICQLRVHPVTMVLTNHCLHSSEELHKVLVPLLFKHPHDLFSCRCLWWWRR
jgi:probable DNA repair protein